MGTRQKQSLSGPYTTSRVVFGRLEIEGTWQKDVKRRLILRLNAANVSSLEQSIALFKQGKDTDAPSIPELARRLKKQNAKAPPTDERGRKTFKTISDEA